MRDAPLNPAKVGHRVKTHLRYIIGTGSGFSSWVGRAVLCAVCMVLPGC